MPVTTRFQEKSAANKTSGGSTKASKVASTVAEPEKELESKGKTKTKATKTTTELGRPCHFEAKYASFKVGVPVPKVELMDSHGVATNLQDIARITDNGVVVINFPNLDQCTLLAQCINSEMFQFNSLGVQVWGLSSELPANIRYWEEANDLKKLNVLSGRHHYSDEEAESHVKQDEFVRCFFLINPNGEVVHVEVLKPVSAEQAVQQTLDCVRKNLAA